MSGAGVGAYETCFSCSGSGVALGMEGDIVTCHACRGACVLRCRDHRGRFISAPTTREDG